VNDANQKLRLCEKIESALQTLFYLLKSLQCVRNGHYRDWDRMATSKNPQISCFKSNKNRKKTELFGGVVSLASGLYLNFYLYCKSNVKYKPFFYPSLSYFLIVTPLAVIYYICILGSEPTYTIPKNDRGKISVTRTSLFKGNKIICICILKIFLSTHMMIALTIYLELLSQGVERQPGPPKNKSNMAIVTYNCNGLGDPKKLKRLLIKCNEMVNKGSIIFLQETHIVDTGYLETIWKHKFVSNCIATNSAGVIILFNKQYDQVYKHTDMEGRQLLVVIHSEEKKFILANAYFPNDHKQGITFAENIYTRILEAQANYPEYVTLYAGDWNVCLAPEDSINRSGSQSELVLSNIIKHNNEIAELSDAYRFVHAEKGFTWKRGVKYSRLDYIFVSNCATNNISGATTDWAFEASDHAAVRVELTSKEEIEKGPGIVKVNIKILEDPVVSTQIGKEIEEMMN